MTNEEIIAQVAQYEKGLNNPKLPDVSKKILIKKIEELKSQLAEKSAEKEVTIQKEEVAVQEDLDALIAKLEKGLTNALVPEATKKVLKQKIEDAKAKLAASKKDLAEDKKEAVEEKKEVKEAVKEVEKLAKVRKTRTPKEQKVAKIKIPKVEEKKRQEKSKERKTKLKKTMTDLERMISKNKELKARYSGSIEKFGAKVLENDSKRPAKPFGYRFRGKNDYRDPKKVLNEDQFRKAKKRGILDYEARADRADKFPNGIGKPIPTKKGKATHLAPQLEHGGDVMEKYIVEQDKDGSYKVLNTEIGMYVDYVFKTKADAEDFKREKDIQRKTFGRESYFADGGMMADGGVTHEYIEVNGTSYTKGTPQAVIDVLENARMSKRRIKIYYGDVETGRDYHEEYDTTGTVGRSTGLRKVPLLISTSRSTGGGAIGTHFIVKIKDIESGRVLYKNDKYQQPSIEIEESPKGDEFVLMVDGEMYSRHKSKRSADLLKSKLMADGGMMAHGGEMMARGGKVGLGTTGYEITGYGSNKGYSVYNNVNGKKLRTFDSEYQAKEFVDGLRKRDKSMIGKIGYRIEGYGGNKGYTVYSNKDNKELGTFDSEYQAKEFINEIRGKNKYEYAKYGYAEGGMMARGGKVGRKKYTYIPQDEIESISTWNGVSFEGDDILDGAYIRGNKKYEDGGVMEDLTEYMVTFKVYHESGDKSYLPWIKTIYVKAEDRAEAEELAEIELKDEYPDNEYRLDEIFPILKSKLASGGVMAKGGKMDRTSFDTSFGSYNIVYKVDEGGGLKIVKEDKIRAGYLPDVIDMAKSEYNSMGSPKNCIIAIYKNVLASVIIDGDEKNNNFFARGGKVDLRDDAQRFAKPSGWRWKEYAVTDGIVSRAQLAKSPTEDQREEYPEYVYYETRKDKSDKKPSYKYTSI